MAKSSQKGLGKGLGALFSDAPVSAEPQAAPQTLPIQKLEPNPNQPRRDFDEEALAELADSIAQHGLIQPITVRPLDTGYYQIIAGERRWRASGQAGLLEVVFPVIFQLKNTFFLFRVDFYPSAQGFSLCFFAFPIIIYL